MGGSNNALVILIIVIVTVAVVAGVSFLIYRLMHPRLKEQPRDEQQDIQEELDRVLVPVEDEETAKQISEYKDEEDE